MKSLLAVLLLFVGLSAYSQEKELIPLRTAHDIANSNPDSALVIYDSYINSIHPDSLLHVKALTGKGNAFQFKSQFDSSLAVKLKALRICEKMGYDHEAATNKNNIGSLYMTLGQMEDAGQYLQEAYDAFLNLQDTVWVTRVIINQAGVDYLTGKQDESLKKLKRAAYLCRLTGNLQSEGGTYTNISIVYRAQGKVDSALLYVDKGIELLERQGDQRAIILSLEEKGKILQLFQRYKESQKVYLQMNEMAREMD